MLQNQLSTLCEEVHSFHSTLKKKLHDTNNKYQYDTDNVRYIVNINKNSWNKQFSHIALHIKKNQMMLKILLRCINNKKHSIYHVKILFLIN